jgi:glutaredoxin
MTRTRQNRRIFTEIFGTNPRQQTGRPGNHGYPSRSSSGAPSREERTLGTSAPARKDACLQTVKRRALLYCIGWLGIAACRKDEDSAGGSTPTKLAPFELRDDTQGVVLTWIDEQGHVHTAFKPSEIPEKGRGQVRVVSEKSGQGDQLYVANLRKKNADGSYRVGSMPRSQWEQAIEARRKAYQARQTKKAPAPAAGSSATGLRAIVYGAAWCQPCHQATAFLKAKGVAVVEYDIEKEPARATEMQQKLRRSGSRGGSIPVIDLAGQVFVGFDRRRLGRALTKLRFRQERR